jgi:hypothetical protein
MMPAIPAVTNSIATMGKSEDMLRPGRDSSVMIPASMSTLTTTRTLVELRSITV